MYMLPFLAVACSTEELENVADPRYDSAQELQGVVMTIPDFNWEGGTRISLTETENGMAFSWVDGDVVGVYASKSMANFNIETIGSDAKSASFDGGGFSLTTGSTYYAFNPYNAAGTSKTAVPVSYTGQTQSANANASHLGAYDFMTSKATAYDTNKALFNFAHLGAVMRIKLAVPTGIDYQSLKITSPDTPFVTAGTVDLTAETPVVTATETSNEITLGLDFTTSGDTLLTLYTMVAPVDLSSSTLTFTLTDNSGSEYTTEVAGKNMLAGSAYGYEGSFVIQDDTPYVTFTADAEQTFQMSSSVSTLEYSVNGGDWTELGTTQVTFGGEHGNLRLRGKSSVGTNAAQISFGNGNTTEVACSGDIRTLVNYENYNTANTSEAIFINLFQNCRQLTSAPDLPITELGDGCYNGMFQGCTSLTTAPALPATQLTSYCYFCMFDGCTSLTQAPELPSTTLYIGCYKYMFHDCKRLTQAPELPAITISSDCYYGMFSGCSSLTQAPELPATNLNWADYCYSAMFNSCTKLTQAPQLPATTLAKNCYDRMFMGCTSLVQAPELPATTLLSECYQYMFSSCSNLNHIKMMATNISATNCLNGWVSGVSSTGTFVKNSAATWDKTGTSGIPSGWTVETADE